MSDTKDSMDGSSSDEGTADFVKNLVRIRSLVNAQLVYAHDQLLNTDHAKFKNVQLAASKALTKLNIVSISYSKFIDSIRFDKHSGTVRFSESQLQHLKGSINGLTSALQDIALDVTGKAKFEKFRVLFNNLNDFSKRILHMNQHVAINPGYVNNSLRGIRALLTHLDRLRQKLKKDIRYVGGYKINRKGDNPFELDFDLDFPGLAFVDAQRIPRRRVAGRPYDPARLREFMLSLFPGGLPRVGAKPAGFPDSKYGPRPGPFPGVGPVGPVGPVGGIGGGGPAGFGGPGDRDRDRHRDRKHDGDSGTRRSQSRPGMVRKGVPGGRDPSGRIQRGGVSPGVPGVGPNIPGGGVLRPGVGPEGGVVRPGVGPVGGAVGPVGGAVGPGPAGGPVPGGGPVGGVVRPGGGPAGGAVGPLGGSLRPGGGPVGGVGPAGDAVGPLGGLASDRKDNREVEQLRSQLFDMSSRLRDLESQRDQLTQAQAQIDNHAKRLISTFQAQQLELKTHYEGQLHALHEQNQRLVEEARRWAAQSQTLIQRVTETQRERTTLHSRLQHVEAHEETFREQLAEKDRQIQQLKHELVGAVGGNDALAKHNATLRATLTEREQTILDLSRELQTERVKSAALESRGPTVAAVGGPDSKYSAARVGQLEAANAELQRKLVQALSERDAAIAQARDTKTPRDRDRVGAEDSALRETISRLTRDNEALKTDNLALRTTLSEGQAENETLRGQIAEIQHDYRRLDENNGKLREDVATLEANNAALEANNNELNRQLAAERDGRANDRMEYGRNLENFARGAEAERNALRADMEREFADRMGRIGFEFKAMEDRLHAAEARVRDAEARAAAVDALRGEIKNVRAELAVVVGERNALEANAKKFGAERGALEKDRDQYKEIVDHMRGQGSRPHT